MQTSIVLLSTLAVLGASMPLSQEQAHHMAGMPSEISPVTAAPMIPIGPVAKRQSGPPLSDGTSILDTANKWRSAYNLPTFNWDDTLASDAAGTGQGDNGVNEIHTNVQAGTAQVIAPGMSQVVNGITLPSGVSSFEASYVAGWLCEVATDPQIANQCGPINAAMDYYYTDTGHHDILVDPQYNTIGCAFAQNANADPTSQYQGLWVCNLGTGAGTGDNGSSEGDGNGDNQTPIQQSGGQQPAPTPTPVTPEGPPGTEVVESVVTETVVVQGRDGGSK